jgi:hypothetical protein
MISKERGELQQRDGAQITNLTVQNISKFPKKIASLCQASLVSFLKKKADYRFCPIEKKSTKVSFHLKSKNPLLCVALCDTSISGGFWFTRKMRGFGFAKILKTSS